LKTGGSSLEIEHCREVALKPGSLFEFTSRFLPADQIDEYLALYAITQLIQAIPAASFDDEVKWAKLKWWNEELAADPGSASRHPVLRVMWACGARVKLDNLLLQRLVRDAVMQMDIAPDSDVNSMFERLAASGSTAIELELALAGSGIDKQSLANIGAASGLSAVLSSFSAGGQPGFDRIPLSILAKFNLSPAQLEQHRQELAQILADLAAEGLDWFSKGMTGLAGSAGYGAGKHLQLRCAMENRGLTKLRKNAIRYLDTHQRFGPADAWFAWRFLRRLDS